ncbi:hypothetical protein AAG906_026654 [Vitis piasezkii]
MIERQLQQGQPWCPMIVQWVRPIHLDDEVGNPNPRSAHAREFGVNVEPVLSKKYFYSYDGLRGGNDDGGDNAEEILMNVNIVNIQSANLHVKMISHTTHRMKTMALEELVQHRSYWEAL